MSPKYPKSLQSLISYLTKLPGVGNRTAERFAFQMLQWKPQQLEEFANILHHLKQSILFCQECGCIMDEKGCPFCSKADRNKEIICVIASPKDAFAIDATQTYQGLFHVIDNLLSPLDGYGFEGLHLMRLQKRIETYQIKEIILALDSTLEGDATSLFIKDQLHNANIQISRLAFGLPVGSSFEYIDSGTLSRAFIGRQNF